MKKCVSLLGYLALSLATFFTSAGWAQLYTGSLTGVVADPSGAVVPNASVTATDVGKGFQYKSTANSVGRYVLRSLPPATYELRIEATGFRTYVQPGITLNVNQNATVDVTLQVGPTTQSVEVTAAAPLLAAQDATTGQEVNRTFINDLPLIGRSVYNLAFLAPGISQAAGSTFGPGGRTANNFVSNGGRNATADVLLDGISTTNFEQNSGIQVPLYTPSVDAVQEFKVQQNNFSAEIGLTGGTVVNVVTRSGTNNFHGSLYEFLRNNSLDANNFFNNANHIKLPALRLNDFGGTVGGPIKKDKAFFFFDYEGTRSSSLVTHTAGVPTVLERKGDFGEICTLSGGKFDSSGMCSNSNAQLWDPFSGVFNPAEGGPDRTRFIPFNNLATYQSPGNPKLNGTGFQLPPGQGNLIDPVALKLMQFYPLPNVNVGLPSFDRFNDWIGSGANTGSNNQFDIKIDHRFNDRNLLSAKFARRWGKFHGANCFGNVADPCTQGPGDSTAHLFSLNFNRSFSPTTMLAFSYGFSRSFVFTHGIRADFPNFDPVKDLGLPSYITRSGIIATPAIHVFGGYHEAGGNDAIGSQAWSVLRWGQETHHLLASLTQIRGRHELKFGGEMRAHRQNFLQSGVPEGIYTFDFNTTSQHPWWGGGDALAGFLIGAGGPGAWGQYEVPVAVSTLSYQYGGYFQDNWRATDKLTLNLGVRYDLDTPRTERFNRQSWVDPNIASPLQVSGLPNLRGGLVFASGKQRKPFDADTSNFAPRIGLAYRFTNKTVLRAGYGIFSAVSRIGAAGTGAGGFQGFNWNTNWLTTFQADGATPWGRLSNPFPITGPNLPPGNSLGALTGVGLGISGPIRTWNTTPYTQTWSFGFQHQLPGDILIDANYVGTKGTHLYFGGAGGLNFLGPQVESFSSDQITALNTFVPNPFFGIVTDPTSSLSKPKVVASQLAKPFPQFTSLGGADPPWANSIYHAFQLRVEKRLSHGLQLLTTYTISKSIDNASVAGSNTTWLGGFTSLQDPNKRFLERSLSQFDIPQVLQLSYVYQLPWGRGKHWGNKWNGWVDGFLGGWQTNGTWRFDNGQPIALQLSGGQSLPTYGGQRPNLLAPLTRNHGSTTSILNQYFANPQVAVKPPSFTVGTAPRVLPNVRLPGTRVASLSVFKEIPLNILREGTHLEVRAEMFNAFNHPQFCGPNATVNTGSFGKVTCQANSPREVQMALKFYW